MEAGNVLRSEVEGLTLNLSLISFVTPTNNKINRNLIVDVIITLNFEWHGESEYLRTKKVN